jgi:hypothetical protein
MHRARRLAPFAFILVWLAAMPLGARAQEAAGSVAAVEGKADLVRGTTSQPASVGAAVNVGDGSDLEISKNVFAPDEGTVSSVVRLLSGKVRALVSEYYKDPLAQYQVETATAVSGVRGTDFIVLYREGEAVTDVVGLTGKVEVHGVTDLRGHGVVVTAKMKTTVARGGYPTEPRPVSEAELQDYLAGLDFIGGGADESMLLDSPIIDQGAVPPEDVGRGGGGSGEGGPNAPSPTSGTPSSMTPSPNTEQPAQAGNRGSPAGVVEQPPDVVERAGEIGVQFNRARRATSRGK